MAKNNADDSKKLEDEVQQKIITPLETELKSFKVGLINNKDDLDRLDESIKLKLGRCQDALKKNIGTFPKIRKLLAVPIVLSVLSTLLIWVSIGIDKSIDWIIDNSSFSNTSKILHLLGIFIFFAVFSVISVFCFHFFIIQKQYKNYLHEIDTNSIDFEKTNFEKIIKGIEFAADGTEEFFKNKITLFGGMNEKIKSEREWYLKCEKMSMIISFFGLQNELENTIVDLKNNPPNDLDNKTMIDRVCEKASFDPTLINLLESYYNGENSKVESCWKKVKNNNKLVDQIVSIIWNLSIFNLYNDINTLKDILYIEELKQILLKTQHFEKSLITNNVLLYTRIYKHLLNYRENLFKESEKSLHNTIYLKRKLTKLEIIHYINFNCDFISNFIDIFSRELQESLEIDFKNAYVDALMAILLNPDINFREKVCIRASKNNEAIYVLMAYQDLREQKGKKNEHFSLYDLFSKDYTPDKMREKINMDHFSEIKFKHFSTALSEGKWIESTQMILLSMIKKTEEQLIKNEKNEMVIKIFAKYFTKININTLDRAVDAGLFTIYLILVPPTDGNFLTDVIDKLSVSIPKNHYISKNSGSTRTLNYEQIKKCESHYKVSLLFDSDTPFYDFKNYSQATRIGIVDNKIPFTTFVDSFNSAVEMILRKKVEENPSKKWNVDFIILRISPSKYSFGLMNHDINIKDVQYSSNLHIATQIAKLASPYLTEPQKTAVATFESDIKIEKIFEESTFWDFMPLNIQTIYGRKYSKFLKNPELMIHIKECLKNYDINSFRELSDSLFHRPKIQNELEKSLTSIIAKENMRLDNPPLSEEIQSEFVSEFLASIKSLYDMWNHEILRI